MSKQALMTVSLVIATACTVDPSGRTFAGASSIGSPGESGDTTDGASDDASSSGGSTVDSSRA